MTLTIELQREDESTRVFVIEADAVPPVGARLVIDLHTYATVDQGIWHVHTRDVDEHGAGTMSAVVVARI